MRWLILLTLAATTALLSAAPAPARALPQTPARDAAVPFQVGERLGFDVTWSTFIVAGTAAATVVERRAVGGSSAYHIVADGRPVPLLQRLYNLYYRMESTLDTRTLLPHRMSLYLEDSGMKRTAVTRFDRASRKAFFELDDAGTPLKAELDVPPQVQDGLSAVYVFRAMTFKAGERVTLPVTDDGNMYTVHADPVAIEEVRVPFGQQQAWRLNVTILDAAGQPAASDAAVWYSTDAARLPLKLQAKLPVGHFVLLLRDVRAGAVQ